LVAEHLAGLAFAAECATDGAQAVARLVADPPDVVVLDLTATDLDGLQLLDTIKRIDPAVPVVVTTAPESVDPAVEAMRRGAFQYLVKPLRMEALRLLLERACREEALRRENRRLRRTIERRFSPPVPGLLAHLLSTPLLDEPMTLAALEERYIEAVLEKAEGDEARAAELLGIDLAALRRRKAGGDR
jgi:two-component system response regulator HydG